MKSFDKAVAETLFDLIYSGVRGHMTNGDTYGLWRVNEQNDTSFAMDVWKSRHAVEMGARATVHIKEGGFRGRARLDVAMADVHRVVQSVKDLTVILVSNGESPLSGTPFDAEINAKYRELAPRMKRAKVTLNTVLVAQDGAFVAWAVNAPEYLIHVPYVAPKPKPVTVELASNTNAPPPSASPAKTPAPAVARKNPVVVPKARPVSAPIVITRETIAQEKRAYQAMTAAAMSNDPLVTALTNPVASSFEATNTPGATGHLVAAEAPGQVDTATTAALTPSNPPPAEVAPPEAETNAAGFTRATETTGAMAVSKITPPPPVKALPVVLSEPTPPAALGGHPFLWAGCGAAAAILGMVLVSFLARRRRPEPSLISQALAQGRAGRT